MAYPLIPLYTLERGGELTDVGTVVFTNLIIAGLLSVPMGMLSDRLGRRAVILLGAVCGAVGHFLLPLASNPAEVLGAFAIAGVGHAAYGPGTQATVGDLASRRAVASTFSLADVARHSGNFAGPAIGGFLATIYGLPSAFVACGIFFVMSAGATVLALPPQPKVNPDGRTQARAVSVRAELSGALRNPGIAAVLVSTFAATFAIQGYSSFIPLVAKSLGADPSYVGILFSAQALTAILSRIPVARYSDRTGKRAPFVIASLLLQALSLAMIITVPNLAVILGWAALFGFGTAMTGTAGLVIMSERVRKEARGAVFGIHNTTLYASSGLGSIVTGFIAARSGFQVAFLTLSVLLAVSAAAFTYMCKRAHVR